MCPLKDLKSSFGALKEGAYSYEKKVYLYCVRIGARGNIEIMN